MLIFKICQIIIFVDISFFVMYNKAVVFFLFINLNEIGVLEVRLRKKSSVIYWYKYYKIKNTVITNLQYFIIQKIV